MNNHKQLNPLQKLAASYGWKGKSNFSYSVGATYYMIGDADIDSTDQGVRVKGDYEDNTMLFLSGTLNYVF